jgi:hypothetical protein
VVNSEWSVGEWGIANSGQQIDPIRYSLFAAH